MHVVLVTNLAGREILENLRSKFSDVFPKSIYLSDRIVDTPILSFSSRKVFEKIVRKIVSEDHPDVVILPYDYRKRDRKHHVTILENTVVLEGPKHIADVIPLLMFLEENGIEKLLELLYRHEYDLYEVLKEYKRKFEMYILENVCTLSRIKCSFGRGGRVIVYENYPIVIAEIIDATYRDLDECLSIAKYYIESGANVVDIGCVAGDPRPWRVRDIIHAIRKELGEVAISVDTFADSEIRSGLEAGADIVLSFTYSKLKDWQGDLSDVGVVVVPENTTTVLEHYFVKCIDIIRKLNGVPILDPLLAPPLYGLSESIARLVELRRKFPNELVLLGAGNVTELVDADSIGINMVLAVIAIEQQVDLILTTEASTKCRGAVRELRQCINMCYVSKVLGKCPKDLSFSMLVAKCKK